MCLIYMVVKAALDLTGIVLNMRMLWSCFKDKTKYKFLQKCRSLTISQCACQVTILLTNAVQSWPGFEFESCNVFGGFLITMNFLLACNMVAILIHLDSGYPVETCENQEAYLSKLKIPAALVVFGSIILWYSYFSQVFLSQMAVKGILFAVMITLVALLYAAFSGSSCHYQLTDASTNTSTTASFSLWNVCQENRITLFFFALSLILVAVLLGALPRSSFSMDFEQAIIFQEFMCSLITRLVGIALPLVICDLIDSSYEETVRKIISI